VTDLDLSPETRLQLAPDVRTRFDRAGHVLLDSPNGTVVDLGPRGYATLSLFSQPVALGDAIDRLRHQEHSSTDFAPTMNVINMLLEEGDLLQSEPGRGPASGWADPVEHARMLHDDRRTGHYLAAISGAVRPGDVVVDIGTGSGVLAVAAARAGASHVYAIEASDIAAVAGRVFAVNGVQEKVTLIPGWSRQIELPQRADLLVAEIIGNEPLEEEILETTLDARRRLLKRDARLIPHALTLLARPLLLPDSEARQRAIGQAAVERWRGLYDMEFQPILDAAIPGPVNMPAEAEMAARWPPVGQPVALAELDLTSFEEATVSASADLVIEPPGAVNAVAITFCASLYGTIKHTLDPWRWPTSSWATSVWVLPDSLTVEPGRALRVQYSRRIQGRTDGISCQLIETAAIDADAPEIPHLG
jgi:protein arginine N-methyltransferase 1